MSKKNKKVLFVATVDSHILAFHLPYLELLQSKGYEVHVATNGVEKIPHCDKKHQISFERNPFKLNNLKAIKQMKKLLEKEHFDFIHCHTPMGAAVTRLAVKSYNKSREKQGKSKTRVIYTAHGFHFFNGAPLLNWLLFYPIEKYLAKYTDILITINKEDYNRAKEKFAKRCRDIQYIPGVGVDPKKFNFEMSDKEKHELRVSLGVKDDDSVLIFPARLDKNKNQSFLLDCMDELVKTHPEIHLLLPGTDELNGAYQAKAKSLNLDSNVHFLGRRDDIPALLQISNLVVSSSKREGLPVNIIEAFASNLPVIALNCRGMSDLIKTKSCGYVVPQGGKSAFVSAIKKVQKSPSTFATKSEFTQYSLPEILPKYEEVYDKKKKVLHVLASNKYSGAENVACTIIKHLDDEYDMAYCSPDGQIREALKERNINFIPLNKLSVKELKKAIKEFDPDIIHAHDANASVQSAICVHGKIKIISHIHGNHENMRKPNPKSILFKICSKYFSKIIWVSQSSLDNFAFKDKVKSKSEVLLNAIDADEVREKAEEKIDCPDLDLIYVGRLAPPKNPFRLIKIVALIKEKMPNIKVGIVGDGEDRQKVEKIIKEKNLSGNIILFGRQPNPFPYMKKAKIFIMTSDWEGLPMSALEAQALGLPIFSTPVDGLKNIVINGESGFLSWDNKELLNKICIFLQNPKTVKNVSIKILDYSKEIKAIYE